jgi:dihydroorotate dehydrogenase (fumarate)
MTMDLTTRYLGLELEHPFVVGASPLTESADAARAAEDAGASAIVMRSIFEEQITREVMATYDATQTPLESFGEALSYLPEPDDFDLGPDTYLGHVRKIKEAVSIPVSASLNGITPGGWLQYALAIEEAGADALELNLYDVVLDPDVPAAEIEDRAVEVVRSVCDSVSIPVAVKLSPFYTSMANFGWRLYAAGASGLVLFNRFFEPDIDLEELELTSHLVLSSSAELLLRVRWLSVLSAHLSDCSFAVSGGVHTATDAVKALMAGAHTIQTVSALLQNGPDRLSAIRDGVIDWMVENEYDSLDQLRGSMNAHRAPNPEVLERSNYMHLLQTWKP